MGFWNLYFIAVLYLAWAGDIQPVWWLNLLFALALLVPLHKRWQSVTRQVLAVLAGGALLYYQSNLPPFAYVLRQIPGLASFSPGYMMELLRRVFRPAMVYIPILVAVIYAIVNRWVRVTTFVLLALVIFPLWQGMGTLIARSGQPQGYAANPRADASIVNAGAEGSTGSYDEQLAAFHHAEKSRRVAFFPQSADKDAQFDIIVIHVCSLSWDDLDVANMRDNPLFDKFDYVFKNFSSAASYSGPAAIRLLRASCGQQAHQELYSADAADCHVFADLAAAGYDVQFMMNHNGRFDDFVGLIQREIGRPGIQPQSVDGLPPFMREFDGSQLVNDYDALARWYQQQAAKGGGPVALYYNTVTMHDGNRLPGNNLTSLQSYPIRLTRLLNDIDRFTEVIASSGRKAVVIFVPEHGAALRGDAGQIAGLREVPSPHIIHVPVGVRLIGLPADKAPSGHAVAIDTPTSYLALAQLVSNLVANSPFKTHAPALDQYARDLPQTRLVGENDTTVTLGTANGYVIHTPDGVWMEGK
ncbi:cellulose biosynthesis protein BcsG [Dyella japonica]|uniref:Cellulose synthase n=1 Tax=Dyella japonica A8 TaxID=1217721 RepID=A0A075K6L8_9GAMM|nr:cellulose biosynthesis protein BcsG [Dyella japonica]AIF47803.1 cellulose synthase [Dyella japonica A8]